jgi:hypothetical protein
MKLSISLFTVIMVLLLAVTLPSTSTVSATSNQGEPTPADKLVYADFEKFENGRTVSNGGGLIQVYTGQESTPVKFTGLANASPGAPERVKIKEGDPNHLVGFDYNLFGPNQWANVTLEIQGHANQSGQTVADDVSGQKYLSMQLYATGVESIRVEVISHGQGIKLDAGFPQMAIRLKPGLNTYLVPLKSLNQPNWVQQKVDTKDVLKKLTAVSISVFCNECTPQSGKVVIDNVVFQK